MISELRTIGMIFAGTLAACVIAVGPLYFVGWLMHRERRGLR
jgi:hypothetical protein